MKNILSSFVIPFLGQLIFTLTFPITLTIVAIFYLYKQILISCADFLGKEFIEPVSSSSALFMCDNLTTNPWSIVTVAFTLNEVPTKEKIYSDLEQILELRRPKDKGLIYWKLKAYVVNWKGYFWWKLDKHFSVKNQVHFIKRAIESPEAIHKEVAELMRKPFKANRPLWSITVVTNSDPKANDNKDKCVLLLTFTHGLMDGMTLLKLLYRLDGHTTLPEDFPRAQVKLNPVMQNLYFLLIGLTRGIYDYLKFTPDSNPISCFSKKCPPTGQWICTSVRPINMVRFKKAKQHLKCSFMDLVLAGYIGGLERYMESKGNVPDHIHFLAPIPKVNHPDDDMDNHFYFTSMKLPLKITNLKDRIKAVRVGSHSVSPTPFSGVMDLLKEPLSILPLASFISDLTDLRGYTGLGSIMPATIHRIFGHSTIAVQYWIPIGRFHCSAMTFTVASSPDEIRIGLLIDRVSTSSPSDLENLATCIYNEFENIFHCGQQSMKLL